MDVLFHRFRKIVGQMAKNIAPGNEVITESNVYQEGRPENKPLMRQIIHELMLPGSRINGFENLVELSRRSGARESCLILMEHYSNFDIPCFYELLEQRGEPGEEVSRRIVSVAGTKLNEESRFVRAFTEIFTRVVIVAGRAMPGSGDPERQRAENERRNRINTAALKKLIGLRKSGRIILVFPTGTRYRPWDPSTGRGLKEVDSYIKSYKNMVLVAINGNILLPNPAGMDADEAAPDLMFYTAGPAYDCRQYRDRALASALPDADPKQHVVDTLMAELRHMHAQAEEPRRALLDKSAARS